MKYLLQITRSTRSERPSEQTIYTDSIATDEARFQDVSQTFSEDGFFILSADKTDISLVLVKLLAIMPFTPAKLNAGDGFRVLKYPHSDKWTLAKSLREGSNVQVQHTSQNSFEVKEFGTLIEAMGFLSSIHASDGFVLVDEGEDSQVISSRPSLWAREDEVEILSQKNFFPNRADELDRI